jgi:polar amino acid transport system substrate-binding protein
MKPIILFLTGILLTACVPSASIPTAKPIDKLAEIQARGTLVIATDADYAPQSKLIAEETPKAGSQCEPAQYTANQLEGFDAEVAKELAAHLGVEACFVTPPWSQLVAGNWGDNWDVHVGSVAITFDRMKNLYFTQPYYATPTVLLVYKDNTTYRIPEDLSRKRIGICAGCTFESYLKGTLRIPGEQLIYRIQNAQIVAYENEDPAIKALSMGDGAELDAVMTILPKARTAIEQGSPLRILDEPIMFAYASITLDRAGQRDPMRLFAEINRIIQELHQAGRLKQLSVRYQGLDLTQQAASFDISSLDQFSK